MSKQYAVEPAPGWRHRIHEVIFEADTPAGKGFDVLLIWAILFSVAAVMLDSIEEIRREHGGALYLLEWAFTLLFTIEYVLRILSVGKPLRYMLSFFGLVDLLAILPTYLSLLLPGAQSLLVIRAFRLLRVFRVLKLGTYFGEAEMLYRALRASRPKITVFQAGVGATVVTVGALMYLIEGPTHGYTSIPVSIYWAIVTMTTVGFGDITPHTALGKAVASALMVIGYGIIAVPTGIVTTELARASRFSISSQACRNCSAEDHDSDARFCKNCGTSLY